MTRKLQKHLARAKKIPGLTAQLEAMAEALIAQAEAGSDGFADFHWGDESSDLVSASVPQILPGQVLIELGDLSEISYDTHKAGEWFRFVHDFKRTLPKLCMTQGTNRLVVVGGSYKVTDRGIVG